MNADDSARLRGRLANNRTLLAHIRTALVESESRAEAEGMLADIRRSRKEARRAQHRARLGGAPCALP
jgi:uncharacterized membrane protein YidH (DUF202 family)